MNFLSLNHFLIHRTSLIAPIILGRALWLSAFSSLLRPHFHATSAPIQEDTENWQGLATSLSAAMSRSQRFCFLALTLILHVAERQWLELTEAYIYNLCFPGNCTILSHLDHAGATKTEFLSSLHFFLLWRHQKVSSIDSDPVFRRSQVEAYHPYTYRSSFWAKTFLVLEE